MSQNKDFLSALRQAVEKTEHYREKYGVYSNFQFHAHGIRIEQRHPSNGNLIQASGVEWDGLARSQDVMTLLMTIIDEQTASALKAAGKQFP